MKFGVSGLAAAAFLAATAFAGSAQATAIDKQLTVHVYQLCDNGYGNCASLGPAGNNYFAAQTDAIWSQAGIDVSFVFADQINDSAFLNIDDSYGSGHSFADLASTYGAHQASPSYLSLFLTHTINGAYGEGYVGFGGAVIAMDSVMAYNNGNGRIDTIAHELGHNLGLVADGAPEEDPNSPNHSIYPNELMASGGIRQTPTSAANIAPNGTGLDYIPANEVATARQSSLLVSVTPVPEPGEWAMMGLGLTITAGVARRRKTRA